MPPHRGWRLTSVWHLSVWRLSRISGRRAACAAGWRVLVDPAGLAQGCRCALPLQAWAGGISWRPPAYNLLTYVEATCDLCDFRYRLLIVNYYICMHLVASLRGNCMVWKRFFLRIFACEVHRNGTETCFWAWLCTTLLPMQNGFLVVSASVMYVVLFSVTVLQSFL